MKIPYAYLIIGDTGYIQSGNSGDETREPIRSSSIFFERAGFVLRKASSPDLGGGYFYINGRNKGDRFNISRSNASTVQTAVDTLEQYNDTQEE